MALFLLSACGSTEAPGREGATPAMAKPAESAESAEPATTVVEVQDVRANALPGGQGALYFTVQGGATKDHLLRVETDVATAEIHETLEEDGVMRMVAHPDGFEVPPAGELVFEPGGKHVMLLGFDPAPDVGSVAVNFHFEKAGIVQVDARVLFLATGGDEHHGNHHADHGAENHSETDHSETDHSETDHSETDHSETDHSETDHSETDHSETDAGNS